MPRGFTATGVGVASVARSKFAPNEVYPRDLNMLTMQVLGLSEGCFEVQ